MCAQTDGGLVVVPGSQKIFLDIFRNRPSWGRDGDFVHMSRTDPVSQFALLNKILNNLVHHNDRMVLGTRR